MPKAKYLDPTLQEDLKNKNLKIIEENKNRALATKEKEKKREQKRKAKVALNRTKLRQKKAIKEQSEKLQSTQRRAKVTNARAIKLDKAVSGKAVLEQEELEAAPKDYREYIQDRPVAFQPNPGPQTTFLAAPEEEVLFGGAAGGGKSYAILGEALRYAHKAACRVLILRRTLDELDELIRDSKSFYTLAFPDAIWKKSEKLWEFPSGAFVKMSYLDKDEDVTKYQGKSFTLVIFDELTHWPTPYPWNYLRSRVRTTDPEIKCYMRATCNPGGVGHWWVKEMFIDPASYGKAFWGRDIETGKVLRYPSKHVKAGQPLTRRRFIPSRLQDNPYLWEDGEYEAQLLGLPEIERKRLLEGDWDVAEGRAFPEFTRELHVIESRKYFPPDGTIPMGWYRVRGADYGYTNPSCCLWGAIDRDGTLIIYRELYGSGMTPANFGNKIAEMEDKDPSIHESVLDESCFSTTGGINYAEQINREITTVFEPSERARIPGKSQVHKRFQFHKDTVNPRLLIFSTCTNLIRELSSLTLSKTDSEDVEKKGSSDHAYDALRYMCMLRKVETPIDSYSRLGFHRPPQIIEMVDEVFGY